MCILAAQNNILMCLNYAQNKYFYSGLMQHLQSFD